jgi:hypothetical protein
LHLDENKILPTGILNPMQKGAGDIERSALAKGDVPVANLPPLF